MASDPSNHQAVVIFTPPSGRTFAYASYGDPTGHPVLAFHGTPGSRLKYAVADDCARSLGLHILAIDRWGYGRTPPPARKDISLAGFGDDMSAFVEWLAEQRDALPVASIVGISGGGPYAMATAARLGSRATGLALVAPVAPLRGLNAAAGAQVGMSAFHRIAFFGLPRVPGAVRAAFSVLRLALNTNGPMAMRLVTARACASDRAIACAPGTVDRLATAFREGLSAGASGAVIDMKVFSAQWDIDIAKISAPSVLWIGDLDRNVPIPPIKALLKRMKNLQVIDLPGAGHFWISRHYSDVLTQLKAIQSKT